MGESAAEPVIVWTLDPGDGTGCEWHVDTAHAVTDCDHLAVWRAEVAGINGEWDVCADHLQSACLDLTTPALTR